MFVIMVDQKFPVNREAGLLRLPTQAHKQTTQGHCGLETESAQWANAVKIPHTDGGINHDFCFCLEILLDSQEGKQKDLRLGVTGGRQTDRQTDRHKT